MNARAALARAHRLRAVGRSGAGACGARPQEAEGPRQLLARSLAGGPALPFDPPTAVRRATVLVRQRLADEERGHGMHGSVLLVQYG
ncbi:MAG TPA: hypothetical protein VFP30_04070 [Candidatus Limnocylindria bacterium]|nr:hypothetical protein [Candidatus Limnocylindria bacterium]